MKLHGNSLLACMVLTTALFGLALFATQTSRADPQADAAKAREAEAKARSAVAEQAKAKEILAEAEAAAAKAAAALALAGRGEAVALDLSKHVGMTVKDFAKNTQHPWPAAPTGSQTFAGVPFEIHGATMLWGKQIADVGLKFPEAFTGIPCKQKFAALYLLHGTFYEGAPGEPSFEVVLNYAGGEKQTDAILCIEDSRDWYVKAGEKERGPSAKRSTLAWTGTGKAGERDQQIRFCLTAIENKYPDRLVETIDLVSAKKQTAGCILAITVGKAGLLKPLEKTADPKAPKDK